MPIPIATRGEILAETGGAGLWLEVRLFPSPGILVLGDSRKCWVLVGYSFTSFFQIKP